MKKHDVLGIGFMLASLVFMGLLVLNLDFQAWAFARHQNQLSWYCRPLLIIPIMIFAYPRQLLGVGLSIFALVTSMIWFPQPHQVSPWVLDFLTYEQAFLQEGVTIKTSLFAILIVAFFVGIVCALWRRSWRWAGLILIATALTKLIWSLIDSGRAALTIALPALFGLLVCLVVLKKLKKDPNSLYSKE